MNADVKDYVEALREAAALIEIGAVDVYGVSVGKDQGPYLVTVVWATDSRRDAEELRDRLVDVGDVFALRDQQYGPFHYMMFDSAKCPQVCGDIIFHEESNEEGTNNA